MNDDDLARQMRSLYIRGNFLARNFRHCSDEVKVKLFKSFSSNMYSSYLWSSFKVRVWHIYLTWASGRAKIYSCSSFNKSLLEAAYGYSSNIITKEDKSIRV